MRQPPVAFCRSKRNMIIRRLLPFIATTVLILGIVYVFRAQISLTNILQRIANTDLRLMIIGALVFFIGSLGSIARYKWLINRATGIDASFLSVLTLTNFSFACGYIAPMSVASEIVRIGSTKHLLRITYFESFKLAILDRLFGLAGVVACAALFIPFKLANGFNPTLLVVEGFGFVALFTFLVVFVAGGPWILRRIQLPSKLSDALISERTIFLDRFLDIQGVSIPLLYTLFAVAGFGLGALFVADAMNFGGKLLAIFLAGPTIMLVQSAPFFYAGLGAREATLLLALPEVAADDANLLISLSIVTGVMTLLVSLPGATIFLLQRIWNVIVRPSAHESP